MKVKSNYDIQADKCKLKFIEMDHKKIAQKLNLKYDEEYLYIYFFNQKYRLNKKSGNIEKYDKVNYVDAKYNEVMTLLDLFSYSKEDLSLSGRWINVTHSKEVFKSGAVVNHMDLYSLYANKLSGKIDKLIKACDKLNGIKINKGDVAYIINIFDFLPIMFIFYEKDSEFPAECKFLWDENILNFMHYETTFYVIGHFFERLEELIGI